MVYAKQFPIIPRFLRTFGTIGCEGPSEEFERAPAHCRPEDFDGHTDFYRLTPEQRLEWFEQDDVVPFMMLVFQIHPENAPWFLLSVTWTGSGRLQTVDADTNPFYHL